MKPCVIIEGEAAALLLGRLLESEFDEKLHLLHREHQGNCASTAEAQLRHRSDVALVVGPEAKNPNRRSSERELAGLHAFLASAGRPPRYWRIIYLKTPPEGLLFRTPELLVQLTGREPTPEQRARLRTQSRQVLAEMLGVEPWALADVLRPRLEGVDLSPLAELRPLRRLVRFLRARLRAQERKAQRSSRAEASPGAHPSTPSAGG